MKLCDFEVGGGKPLFLIAGPCVIEGESLALSTAERLRAITERLGLGFVFKSSFDKAKRSSHECFRGLGIEEGLRILDKVKREVGVPVLTDVHEDTPLETVADPVAAARLLSTPVAAPGCKPAPWPRRSDRRHRTRRRGRSLPR